MTTETTYKNLLLNKIINDIDEALEDLEADFKKHQKVLTNIKLSLIHNSINKPLDEPREPRYYNYVK